MKKLLLFLFVATIGCSDGRNEKMTELINQKKEAKNRMDSIESKIKWENEFRIPDTSLVQKPETESEKQRYDTLRHYKRIMTAVDFSIDSLSKMK